MSMLFLSCVQIGRGLKGQAGYTVAQASFPNEESYTGKRMLMIYVTLVYTHCDSRRRYRCSCTLLRFLLCDLREETEAHMGISNGSESVAWQTRATQANQTFSLHHYRHKDSLCIIMATKILNASLRAQRFSVYHYGHKDSPCIIKGTKILHVSLWPQPFHWGLVK